MSDNTLAIKYPPGYPLLLAGVFGLSGFLGISAHTALSVFILVCMGFSSVFIFVFSRLWWTRCQH